jgi:hypothetical protein
MFDAKKEKAAHWVAFFMHVRQSFHYDGMWVLALLRVLPPLAEVSGSIANTN